MSNTSKSRSDRIIPTTGVSGEVKEYFEGWSLYNTVIQENYMAHREVIESVKQRVSTSGNHGLRVLEVGCGDAYVVSQLAQDLNISRYLGIELAGQAIACARTNLEERVGQIDFVQGDMSRKTGELTGEFELIIAGYTIHHLQLADKQRMFTNFGRLLSANGKLIVYDLVLHPDDSRESFLGRAVDYFDIHWTALDRDRLLGIRDHVITFDFPETWATWKSFATTAGLSQASFQFLDEPEFFGFMEFQR